MTVAADGFLTRMRSQTAFAASDDPELDPQAAAALEAAGRDLAARGAGVRRNFVVRAFSAQGRAAALFAVREDAGAAVRAQRAFPEEIASLRPASRCGVGPSWEGLRRSEPPGEGAGAGRFG